MLKFVAASGSVVLLLAAAVSAYAGGGAPAGAPAPQAGGMPGLFAPAAAASPVEPELESEPPGGPEGPSTPGNLGGEGTGQGGAAPGAPDAAEPPAGESVLPPMEEDSEAPEAAGPGDNVVVIDPEDFGSQGYASAFAVSYEQYHAMTGEEQQAWFESFESVEAFFDWYNAAQAEHEANSGAIEIGPGTVIDLGRAAG